MKKMKVIGIVLVVTMMIGGMSTVAFAADKPTDEAQATGDTCKEESFLDYAKSLGVLNESELAELEKTEAKAAELKDQIEAIYQKDELTKADETKLEELYNEMDKLYTDIDGIMTKVYGEKEMPCEDCEDVNYVDYVKELGVLSEAELAEFANVEKKAEELWNKIDALYNKENITEADEAKAMELTLEADKLYAGIEDIMQKIKDAEQKEYFDYVKELGVLSDEEYANFVKTEKKIEELYAQMDQLWGDKEELSKEDEAKLDTLDKELNQLYESSQSIYDKIFGVEDGACMMYDEDDKA